MGRSCPRRILDTWKDKTLDYEIETRVYPATWAEGQLKLEKIRLSITRLKHAQWIRSRRTAPSWKDKTLDYEIETSPAPFSASCICSLEKIRLSITRLKQTAIIRLNRDFTLEKIRLSITRLKQYPACPSRRR